MTKKHIIFDLDGTLSNTAIATLAAFEAAEKIHPIPSLTIHDIHNAMGLGGLEFFECLLPTVPSDVLLKVEKDVDNWEQENIIRIGKHLLFHGVPDMLDTLYSRGYTLHIASTGSQIHVRTIMDATGIEKFFASISCGKPAKIDMVAQIIAGLDKDDCAMVGDMFKDSEAAKNNGILAIGAGYGYLSKADFGLFDVVLDRPNDIFMHV